MLSKESFEQADTYLTGGISIWSRTMSIDSGLTALGESMHFLLRVKMTVGEHEQYLPVHHSPDEDQTLEETLQKCFRVH